MVRKLDGLERKRSLFGLRITSSTRRLTTTVVELPTLKQAAVELQRIAPTGGGFSVDIKETFGEFQ